MISLHKSHNIAVTDTTLAPFIKIKRRIYEPYQSIWRLFQLLQSYVKDQENPKDYRDHLAVLLEFLMHCNMPAVTQLVTLSTSGATAETICYQNLWFLFPPGTMAVVRETELRDYRVLRVTRANAPIKRIDGNGKLSYHGSSIDCGLYENQRGHLRLSQSRQAFHWFEGNRHLRELQIVPLTFLQDYEAKELALISRGQKFWDLRGRHLQELRYGSNFDGTAVVS